MPDIQSQNHKASTLRQTETKQTRKKSKTFSFRSWKLSEFPGGNGLLPVLIVDEYKIRELKTLIRLAFWMSHTHVSRSAQIHHHIFLNTMDFYPKHKTCPDRCREISKNEICRSCENWNEKTNYNGCLDKQCYKILFGSFVEWWHEALLDAHSFESISSCH